MSNKRLAASSAACATRRFIALLAGLLFPALGSAQQLCARGIQIDGTITDPTGALLAGAQVRSADGKQDDD